MILHHRWVLMVFSFLVIHAGTHISLLTQHDLAVSDFYLPTAFSIILINWFGPKIVLPVIYINAVGTSILWGNPVENWPLWFFYGIPETLYAFLSWFLFRKILKGKFWFPDNHNTILFLVFGILIPAVIESALLQGMLVWSGAQSTNTFLPYVSSNIVSEFATSFFFTFPALYYLTPWIQQKGLLHQSGEFIPRLELIPAFQKKYLLELGMIFLCLFALVFFVEFRKYWFVYGFFSLYAAIRFGFGPAIITNLYILTLAYVIPRLNTTIGQNDADDFSHVTEILLGANFLFVFVAITGRVISDIRMAEAKLIRQNRELEQTNEELDRFVYSVSHDLSAPLKSILGLVNISRLSHEPSEHRRYIDQIEKSVLKLETFIAEILDYTRNKRQHLVIEKINFEQLFDEILSNLRYLDEFRNVEVIFDLHVKEIYQDHTRVKIAFTNVISNASKFKKRFPGHHPYIKISSRKSGHYVVLDFEDNGQGIIKEEQPRVFEMFHRGNEHSTGSGLGLYIAKESIQKAGGNITFRSEFGQGSKFSIKLRNRSPESKIDR